MSLHALRLIKELLSKVYSSWESDEEFQRELFFELMNEFNLIHLAGSYNECQKLEEELKKMKSSREGRKKLKEIIQKILKRLKERKVKKREAGKIVATATC
ncbi:MAG: hypothetical protein HZB67_04540 [Candidatus Aenigmarchaeota archaeon]|nr:hypothetical protein [Candidatus Aenigmarchaeota archaeon]